jgi:hypothetical protein
MDAMAFLPDILALIKEPGIFEESTPVPTSADWKEQAACAKLMTSNDPTDVAEVTEMFFDRYDADTELADSVDRLCLKICPVRDECVQFAKNNKATGVHGGIYFSLGRWAKSKNAHKAPSLIKELKEKYEL